MTSLEQYDNQEIRCVHLGGPVTFNYCRQVTDGLPCKLTILCWHRRFDIVPYLREHFRAADLRKALDPPPGSAVERLVKLMERFEAEGDGQSDSG